MHEWRFTFDPYDEPHIGPFPSRDEALRAAEEQLPGARWLRLSCTRIASVRDAICFPERLGRRAFEVIYDEAQNAEYVDHLVDDDNVSLLTPTEAEALGRSLVAALDHFLRLRGTPARRLTRYAAERDDHGRWDFWAVY